VVRVHIANGGQEGRRGGLAAPGQLHQELVVRAMGKQLNGLVEPQWLFGQGIDQVVCQCGDLALVDARGVTETAVGCGQVIDAVEGLRAPLTAAMAGLPLFQKARAAVAQGRFWSWMCLQEAHSGRLRQVLHQGMEFRKGEVDGRSQLMLAKLYGLTSWHYDDEKDDKRAEYWKNAFALISQFDLEKEYDGSTILQLSSSINDKLIDYFLKNPTHLRSMKPRDFEQLIAELFDACGFTEYAVA
jgi:hypothetical protein